jgi:hypothetical protein
MPGILGRVGMVGASDILGTGDAVGLAGAYVSGAAWSGWAGQVASVSGA